MPCQVTGLAVLAGCGAAPFHRGGGAVDEDVVFGQVDRIDRSADAGEEGAEGVVAD
jgi:hypothetical protein